MADNLIEFVPLQPTELEFIQPQQVVKSVSLSKLQFMVAVAGDENAPHFVPAQEPLQEARAYQAKNGQWYYRPILRVARRAQAPFSPEVRFLLDAQGTIRLEFELEEIPPAGLPEGTEPFPVRVTELHLQWMEHGALRTRAFDSPMLTLAQPTDDENQPNFAVFAGASLTPEEVQPISEALRDSDAGATLQVSLNFGYWVDLPPDDGGVVIDPDRFRRIPPIIDEPDPPIFRRVIDEPDPVIHLNHILLPRVQHVEPVFVAHPVEPNLPVAMLLNAATRNTHATVFDANRLFRIADERGTANSIFDTVSPELFEAIWEEQRAREGRPDFRSPTYVLSLDFHFDPDLDQNRAIYAAIIGDRLSAAWESHPFGMISKAPAANTVYRLPDEMRLAYNPALRAPHLLPTLYRNDQEEVRVRVVLRSVPWHDPAKLTELRDELFRSTAGGLAAPRVMIGGYQSAVFKLTTAFPEQIHVVDGGGTVFNLEDGFEVNLDLSLEFYRFACELLVGPVGLTGQVSVTLPIPDTTDTLVKQVPVRLSLDDLSALPLVAEVAPDTLSPTSFTLANHAGAEVRLGGCAPRLLQLDSNSVMPLAVFEARTSTTFPATVAVDGTLSVDVVPAANAQDAVWNAILVEVLGEDLTATPREVLDRIHEITPSGTLAWRITVECPTFLQALPERFSNLHRIEVAVLRTGFAPQHVTLGPGTASATITMQRTLKEIIAEDALGLGTFTFQVRNIYLDHAGQWGPEQSGQGNSVFAFPNAVEND